MSRNKRILKEAVLSPLFVWFFAIFAVLLIPLYYDKAVIDVTLIPKFLALSVLLLMVYLWFLFFKKPALPYLSILKQPSVLLWIAFILISALSLIGAFNPYEGVFDVLKLTAGLLFVIATTSILINTGRIQAFILSAVILSYVLSITGIYQYFTFVFRHTDLNVLYKIVGIWSHKNVFSGMVFLMIPFLFYAIFRKGLWLRVLAIIALCLSLSLLLLLQTRSLWLAVLAFLFVTVAFCYYIRKECPGDERKELKRSSIYVLGAFVLAIFLSSVVTFYSVSNPLAQEVVPQANPNGVIANLGQRAASIFDTKTANRQTRLEIWEYTLRMAKDYPVLGVGAGNWKLRVGEYYDPGYMQTWFHNWRRPHNDFLLVLSEKGIVGLITYLVFFVSLLWMTIRIIRREKSLDKKFLSILMLGGILGFLIDSSFSFPYERVDELLVLMLFVSIILWIDMEGKQPAQKPLNTAQRLLSLTAIIILAISFLIGSKIFKAENNTNKAYAAIRMGKWPDAVRFINEGYTKLAQIDPSNNPMLWFRGNAFMNMQEFGKAEKDFNRALEQMPYGISVMTDLGLLYIKRQDYPKAINVLQQALDIFPNDLKTLYFMGLAHYQMGDYQRALDYLYPCWRGEKTDKSVRYLIEEARKKISAAAPMQQDSITKSTQ